jgi:hypothetical protein
MTTVLQRHIFLGISNFATFLLVVVIGVGVMFLLFYFFDNNHCDCMVDINQHGP